MATHSLKNEDLKRFQSANTNRFELEKTGQEWFNSSEWAAEEEYEANQMAKPMETMVDREIRNLSKYDGVAEKARTNWWKKGSAANTVGMALIVASTAAEASYNKAMIDAQKDSDAPCADLDLDMIKESDGSMQTLTQLADRTEEIRRELESKQKTYYVEYQDTREEAIRVINSAKREYEREMRELDEEMQRIDLEYKKELSAIRASLNPLQKTRESQIKSSMAVMEAAIRDAQSLYEEETKKIRSIYDDLQAEKEIQDAARRMEERVLQAKLCNESNVQKYDNEYKRRSAFFTSHMDKINQRRNAEIKNIINKSEAAKTKRNTIINRQNDVIKVSQIKYVDAVQASSSENTNSQIKLDKYQARSAAFNKIHIKNGEQYALVHGSTDEKQLIKRVYDDRKAAQLAAESGQVYTSLLSETDCQMAQQIAIKYAAEAMIEHTAIDALNWDIKDRNIELNMRSLGAGATSFSNAFEQAHLNIGEDLALQFGSAEEIRIVNAVNADLKAKRAATESGSLHVPLTTQSNYNRADQIVAKYAGGINSEKEIKKTLDYYRRGQRELAKKAQALKNKSVAHARESEQLSKKIKAAQEEIDRIESDKLALKTGTNSVGEQLTQEQRIEIVERIRNENDFAEKAKALAELKTKQNALNEELVRAQEAERQIEDLINRLNAHTNVLEKDSEMIVKTMNENKSSHLTFISIKTMSAVSTASVVAKTAKNKENKKSQHTTMILNSVSRIKKDSTIDLNAQANIAEKSEAAINIGKFGLKSIALPAGLLVTASGATFRKIGDKTALSRVVAENKLLRKLNSNEKPHVTAANLGSQTANETKAKMQLSRFPQNVNKRSAIDKLRFKRSAASEKSERDISKSKFGIRNAVARTKFGRAALESVELAGERLSSFAKKVYHSNLKGWFKRLGNKAAGLIGGMAASMVTSASSAGATAFGSLIIFVPILMVIVLVIAMIFSTFSAVLNASNQVQLNGDDPLVKNYPQYIAINAANYRNAELEIFELFNAASSNSKIKIKANENPIYYVLYDNATSIFKAPNGTGGTNLSPTNQSALSVFRSLEKRIFQNSTLDKVTSDDFKGNVNFYDSAKLSYYYTDQVVQDKNGNYKFIGEPSEYEISNAKDALAIVDSLYISKQDTMQRVEVLAYLGVGDYQLGYKDTNQAVESLFWTSHKLIYNSGTKSSDVWFHETNSDAKDINGIPTYVVNSKFKLNSTGTSRNEPISNAKECDNKKEVRIEIEGTIEVDGKRHDDLDDFQNDIDNTNKNPYREYTVQSSAYSTSGERETLTPTQIYYYYGGTTNPTITLSSGKSDDCELTVETVEVGLESLRLAKGGGNGSFVPRLTAPDRPDENGYWTYGKYVNGTNIGSGNNPYEKPTKYKKFASDVLPNCVAWAYGRFYEIMGPDPDRRVNGYEYWAVYNPSNTGLLKWGNAGDWWGCRQDGYERSTTTPKLGAVVCWSQTGSFGHVAIVEQIFDDGSILTSESGYNTASYWWTTRRYKDGIIDANGNRIFTGYDTWGAWAYKGYKFQGFIYNPGVSDEPGDNICDILRLYSPDGNGVFYAVDQEDNYVGRLEISSSSNTKAYKAMTKNGAINSKQGYLDLQYFELEWNYDKECYEAKIASWSSKNGMNKYTDTKSVMKCPRPTLNIDKIKIDCKHDEKVDKIIGNTHIIQVCMGHADLDVAMVVSLIDGGTDHPNANNKLFEDAMRVDGLLSNTTSVDFKGIENEDADLAGWKGDDEFVYAAFNPADDWSSDSELRNIARIKAQADLKYTIPGSVTTDQLLSYQGSTETYKITHKGVGSAASSGSSTYFSDAITINYQGYKNDNKHIPYYMFAPSVESSYDIPLIIWLHGAGECNVAPGTYERAGIMPTLLNWKSSGVNAYIVCPQLVGQYNGSWNSSKSEQAVKSLIDYMIENYNIDANRIYLVGHSLGGQGTLYMASKLSGYFAACASLSPYFCGIDPYTYDSALIAIAGTIGYHEDPASVQAAQIYAKTIGEENVYYTNSDHGSLPRIVFTADNDANGQSDLLEWFFKHSRNGNSANNGVGAASTETVQFDPLAKSPEKMLLYGMRYNGQTYYVESYISGAQVNIPVYIKDEQTGELSGPSKLSIRTD